MKEALGIIFLLQEFFQASLIGPLLSFRAPVQLYRSHSQYGGPAILNTILLKSCTPLFSDISIYFLKFYIFYCLSKNTININKQVVLGPFHKGQIHLVDPASSAGDHSVDPEPADDSSFSAHCAGTGLSEPRCPLWEIGRKNGSTCPFWSDPIPSNPIRQTDGERIAIGLF